MYYVFKRNDGYVGAIKSGETVRPGEQPSRLRAYTVGGERISFEVLLKSEDWDECMTLIAKERGIERNDVIESIGTLPAPTEVSVPIAVDPDEVKRRALDDIDAQLKSVRERLRGAHSLVADLHGVGHPAQSTLEIALVALNDAIRFNKKGEF